MNMKRKYILVAAALAVIASACEKVPSSDEFEQAAKQAATISTARMTAIIFLAFINFPSKNFFYISGLTGNRFR